MPEKSVKKLSSLFNNISVILEENRVIKKLIEAKNTKQLTNPKMLGRVKRLENGNDKYIKILKKNFPNNFNLKGTKIVLDCGNGAGYIAAPKLL